MENVSKHCDTKVATKDEARSCLVSEQNFHISKKNCWKIACNCNNEKKNSWDEHGFFFFLLDKRSW